jgi:short-subunit dehydrogenase
VNGTWKVVWITGASSGIGAEIAKQLADAGTKVAASARHMEQATPHPNITPFAVDVTDAQALRECVAQIEHHLGPIDLAIFGAGAYEVFTPETLDAEKFVRINAVNYIGAINALCAVLPMLMDRKSGHVAFIASVAGYQGLPKAAYYSPTKAALINLAEALWIDLHGTGIAVSVINPGFVATAMTKGNEFPMPFLMQPARAAALSIAGLRAKRFEIAYPRRFVFILKLLQWLPTMWKLRLIKRLTQT